MSNNVTGIVLSAGLSGRMNAFKPLLKRPDGKTFIQSIVEKLSCVCDEIVVVTGFKRNKIEENLKSIKQKKKIIFVFNEDYKSGMFSSLQTGLTESHTKWYLYHFVDQPSLPNEFYIEFVNQIEDNFNWIQPVMKQRKGHPILFDDSVKSKIIESSYTNNLREISKDLAIKKKFWEYKNELIFQDIDTPEDYLIQTSTQN